MSTPAPAPQDDRLRFGDVIRIDSNIEGVQVKVPCTVIRPPVPSDGNGFARAYGIGLGKDGRQFTIPYRQSNRADWELLPANPELIKRHALKASTWLSTTSGMDPEVFVSRADGTVIPSWKFLPTEADAPRYNIGHNKPMRVYWDGWQAEMSHLPGTEPRYCHEYCTEDVRAGLWAVLQAARAYDPGAQLAVRDVVEVDPADLAAEDRYVLLGCAPSRNAYPGTEPIQGIDGRTLPIRFAGCHVHTGIKGVPPPEWFPNGTIIMADKIAGVLLTALGRGLENPQRRYFYGRPGEFRLPGSNGAGVRIEYRTPGSFLLRHPMAFNFGMDTVRAALRYGMLVDGRECPLPDAREVIMNCDADGAVRIIKAHEKFFMEFLGFCYGATIARQSMPTILNGLASKVHVNNPEEAWGLSMIHPSNEESYDTPPVNRYWATIHSY